ncbi:26669_t:CDS:2, partial [Dentiscutata erythropus]
DLKQSKLKLSSGNISEENIALGISEVHAKRKRLLQETSQGDIEIHGEEEATKIFLELFKNGNIPDTSSVPTSSSVPPDKGAQTITVFHILRAEQRD